MTAKTASYLIDTNANNAVLSVHRTFLAAITKRANLAGSLKLNGFGGLQVVELHCPATKGVELADSDVSEWLTN